MSEYCFSLKIINKFKSDNLNKKLFQMMCNYEYPIYCKFVGPSHHEPARAILRFSHGQLICWLLHIGRHIKFMLSPCYLGMGAAGCRSWVVMSSPCPAGVPIRTSTLLVIGHSAMAARVGVMPASGLRPPAPGVLKLETPSQSRSLAGVALNACSGRGDFF